MKYIVVFSEECCNVGVFTLSCFLAKFVRFLSNYCLVYKGEGSRCRSRNVFRNSFYLQHGIFSLLLCCKPRGKGKDVKRRNEDMIELRKQRVSSDVRGIVFTVV